MYMYRVSQKKSPIKEGQGRPFIPEDMEIYFYGGNNSDKKAPPPPLSKQPVNSSKKRGAVSTEGW